MNTDTTEKFYTWLKREADERGVSIRQIEQRGGLSNGALSARMRMMQEPLLSTFEAVATAFGLPLYKVMSEAGLIPRAESNRLDKAGDEQTWLDYMRGLNQRDRAVVLTLLESMSKNERG